MLDELDANARNQCQEAESCLAQGKLTEAVTVCQQVIKLKPDFALAYKTLGSALLAQGQLEDAAVAYKKAIELKPDLAEAYADLATIALQQGQVGEAAELYNKAVDLNPDLAIAHWILANLLNQQGQTEAGIIHQQKALALKPDLAGASEHNSLGSVLARQGKVEEAIPCFQRAIQLRPNFAMAYLHLGCALAQQENWEEAIANFQKAIELEPDNAEAHVSLGNALVSQDKFDEAIATFQRVIEFKPHYVEAYIRIATAYGCQDKLDEAISYSLQALSIDPNNAEIYLNLGKASLGKKKSEEAIAYFQQAIEIRPECAAESYLNLGKASLGNRKYEEAIAYFQQAIEIRPEYVEAYVSLLNAHVGLGKIEEAIADCNKALEINPDYAEAYFALATAMGEQEKHEEAVSYFQKAIETRSEYADAYWGLINSWISLRNCKMARQSAELYHQLFEQKDPIRSAIAFISTHVASGLKHERVTAKLSELESRVYSDPGKLSKVDVMAIYCSLLFSLYDLRDSPSENSKFSKLIGSSFTEKVICPQQEPLTIARPAEQRKQQESLRIGFLSPHFGRHSVGWCSGDAIRELSHLNPQLYLYATRKIKADDRTQMFERAARKFHHPKELISCTDIVEQVLQDEIDVLVDLDSLTWPMHGEIFCRQPAPVCISWLGFDAPFLSNKNYFLGDWHTHPPGIDCYYTEQLVRLPNSHMAVSGFERPPLNVDRDAFRSFCGIDKGQVAYLSAGPSRKFTPDAAKAHIQILKHVPNGVLLQKGFGDIEVIQSAYQLECDRQGVEFSRIKFLPGSDTEEKHRTIYDLADISLDSYPYNGGTHNLETLWFNTPLVTRVGEQSFARMGYSFLKTLGIEAGIAWSWEEYAEWGIRFGLDTDLRNSIKAQLIKSKQPDSLSPLWNPRQLAKDMYAIFKELLLKENVAQSSLKV